MLKGQCHSEETKKRIGLAGIGKHSHSDETRKRLSAVNMGNKNALGSRRSEETRKRLSEIVKKNPTKYWAGKKRLEMCGEKNPAWRGGISLSKEYWAFLERHRNYLKKASGGKHTLAEVQISSPSARLKT